MRSSGRRVDNFVESSPGRCWIMNPSVPTAATVSSSRSLYCEVVWKYKHPLHCLVRLKWFLEKMSGRRHNSRCSETYKWDSSKHKAVAFKIVLQLNRHYLNFDSIVICSWEEYWTGSEDWRTRQAREWLLRGGLGCGAAMPHIGCGADVLRWRREKEAERRKLQLQVSSPAS